VPSLQVGAGGSISSCAADHEQPPRNKAQASTSSNAASSLDNRRSIVRLLGAWTLSLPFTGAKEALALDSPSPSETKSTNNRQDTSLEDDEEEEGEEFAFLRSPCGKDCMQKCYENFGAALVPGNREFLKLGIHTHTNVYE
jgi:hypothetical protein